MPLLTWHDVTVNLYVFTENARRQGRSKRRAFYGRKLDWHKALSRTLVLKGQGSLLAQAANCYWVQWRDFMWHKTGLKIMRRPRPNTVKLATRKL